MYLARLYEHRAAKGFSQAELAKRSGVARDAISKIETMRREAQAETVRKLAEALSVEVEDLIYSPEVEPPPWGKATGYLLTAARQESYEKEIALLERWADEADSAAARSIYEGYQAEAEFVRSLSEMDLSRMPRRSAAVIRSYMEVGGNLAAAGVTAPIGMARSLVRRLQGERKRDEKGEDA